MSTIIKRAPKRHSLVLLTSAGQKLGLLKAALRYNDPQKNITAAFTSCNSYINQNEVNRQLKVLEIRQLSAKYDNGQISLQTFNEKLDQFLEQLQINGGSYGLVNLG